MTYKRRDPPPGEYSELQNRNIENVGGGIREDVNKPTEEGQGSKTSDVFTSAETYQRETNDPEDQDLETLDSSHSSQFFDYTEPRLYDKTNRHDFILNEISHLNLLLNRL
ncbi:hypothetical protein FQR65_LT08995 [Abscondita terminalis]|nr:hypothetical protein FQR65_LT08995 [Abscondita terminalis]